MKQLLELKEPTGAITSPAELFKKIRRIKIDYAQENFIAVFLDAKNRIIDSEILFKGGLNSCLIDPKTLYRRALLHNAHAIIVAHNHQAAT